MVYMFANISITTYFLFISGGIVLGMVWYNHYPPSMPNEGRTSPPLDENNDETTPLLTPEKALVRQRIVASSDEEDGWNMV